jgi:hypothetical protein
MSEVQAAHQQQVEQLTSYYMQQVNALQVSYVFPLVTLPADVSAPYKF